MLPRKSKEAMCMSLPLWLLNTLICYLSIHMPIYPKLPKGKIWSFISSVPHCSVCSV